MIPRVVIAGTGSGVGKTTIATGLLAAFAARGVRVAGFKVGPDFIDPSFHALATGRPGRNLDPFLSGPALVPSLFRHGTEGAEMAFVEGVMGLFDGKSGAEDLASTAQVARLLDAPVVLVVDAGGMARSVAALVHGFRSFDPHLRLSGVILNRVGSGWHEQVLREALAPLDVAVLGVLGREARLAAPERHLGLVPVAEREPAAHETVAALGEAVAGACDLEAVAALARSAGPLRCAPWRPAEAVGDARPARPRVAVGRGRAFSFLYQENLELLQAAGAELADFDPLADPELPPGTDALYLGGGFPEVYAGELSANASLRSQVAAFAASGRPVAAECAGFLYLGRELDGWPMCGVLDTRGRMTERLSLGYRDAVALGDSALAAAGTSLRGHEFHYSRLEPAAGPRPAWRLNARGREDAEGWLAGGVHASYLHTHWAATPEVPLRLAAHAGLVRQAGASYGAPPPQARARARATPHAEAPHRETSALRGAGLVAEGGRE